MTKFMDRSFSVSMPGEAASQWPKCGAVNGTFVCNLEFGHRGDHIDGFEGGGCVGWCRSGEHFVWKDGKREVA